MIVLNAGGCDMQNKRITFILQKAVISLEDHIFIQISG